MRMEAAPRLNAGIQIALAAASVLLTLVLAGPGPGGSSFVALGFFCLAPLGGIPAFSNGLRALTTAPSLERFAWARLLAGTAALATPGALSSVFMLREDVRPLDFDLWSTVFLYLPLLGGVVLGVGAVGLLRTKPGPRPRMARLARVRRVAWVGAATLSSTWIFGLWAVLVMLGED